MIFARIAVAGAILCTLWFNASYAMQKATDLPGQIALVALALTVDLCKCGFLPAASLLSRRGRELPAIVLMVLFVPCLAFSIFAGFSSITTNRASTTVATQAIADARARAQSAYDESLRDLAAAKTSSLWAATAGCTTFKTPKHREFCERVDEVRQSQQQALSTLNVAPTVAVDPELAVLENVTGLQAQQLLLTVALWPALLIELVSSLGLYAVSQPTSVNRPTRSRRLWKSPSRRQSVSASTIAPVTQAPRSPPLAPPASGVVWPTR